MCAREAFTLYGRGSGGLSGDNLYTALRCCSVNPTYDSVKVLPHQVVPSVRNRSLDETRNFSVVAGYH